MQDRYKHLHDAASLFHAQASRLVDSLQDSGAGPPSQADQRRDESTGSIRGENETSENNQSAALLLLDGHDSGKTPAGRDPQDSANNVRWTDDSGAIKLVVHGLQDSDETGTSTSQPSPRPTDIDGLDSSPHGRGSSETRMGTLAAGDSNDPGVRSTVPLAAVEGSEAESKLRAMLDELQYYRARFGVAPPTAPPVASTAATASSPEPPPRKIRERRLEVLQPWTQQKVCTVYILL